MIQFNLKNRTIKSVDDFDILISDIAEVMKRVVQAKKAYSEGGMEITASCNEQNAECVIPYFS